MKNEIDLVVNSSETCHSNFLIENIEESDEILIAVAFLKVSGLNEIIDSLTKAVKNGVRIKIIAGQNFAQTEPKALRTLFELFKASNSEIRLAKFSNTETFHPKIFIFKNGDKALIMVGSANLTNGGLVNNYECSLLFKGDIKDELCIRTIKYFEDDLIEFSDKLDLVLLSRYERYFNELKPLRDKLKIKPKWLIKSEDFNYDRLLKHLNIYKKTNWEESFIKKSDSYKKAKKILNKLATSTTITKKEFIPILDELVGGSSEHSAYWTSGGLSRGKNGKNGGKGIYDCYKEFILLIKFVKENQNLSVPELFDKGKLLLVKINGAGVNYFTEILMTYNPDRFANMNKNPITVLRDEAGVNIKSSTSSYNGKDYEEYCNLVQEISSKLGLINMIEIDSYFNNVYWKTKKTKNK
jgi:HKD family nuclease